MRRLAFRMVQAQLRSGSDNLALQAELAGAALGCRYSSSAEYEAALIAERRKAGLYGAPRHRALAGWSLLAASLFLLIAIAI